MTTTTTTTTTDLRLTTIKEVALVGTSNNALIDVEYSANGSSIAHSKDLGSPANCQTLHPFPFVVYLQ